MLGTREVKGAMTGAGLVSHSVVYQRLPGEEEFLPWDVYPARFQNRIQIGEAHGKAVCWFSLNGSFVASDKLVKVKKSYKIHRLGCLENYCWAKPAALATDGPQTRLQCQ
nr:hypothetical protein Iba_chr07cCG10940 [Ipomoea batatas]